MDYGIGDYDIVYYDEDTSYEKEDIEIGHPHNLYPLATEIKYITCPQCNEKIELEATRWLN